MLSQSELEPTQLNGILNVNKPLGMTSHDVVDSVRRMVNTRRVGHAGTLDPAATGVLLVCIGSATRVSDYLMAGTKAYRATIRLGATSTTDDSEGAITINGSASFTIEDEFKRALGPFIGQIDQVPPIYSAIKVGGRPLYDRARSGQNVVVAPRRVRIDALSVVDWRPPEVVIDVVCSKGTYIRALARDIGSNLGVGAYLSGLTRTRSGHFGVEDSLSLKQVGQAVQGQFLDRLLFPLDLAVTDWPAVVLPMSDVAKLLRGSRWFGPKAATGTRARAYDESGRLIALLTSAGPDAGWQPTTVFARDYRHDAA